jgi:hypothetical protein
LTVFAEAINRLEIRFSSEVLVAPKMVFLVRCELCFFVACRVLGATADLLAGE